MAPADWLPFLTVLADRADEIALRGFRKKGLRVEDKADRSPVTEADRAIEETVRTVTRQRHPELGLLGEEQGASAGSAARSEEHTSELQSRLHLVCRLLLEKKKKNLETSGLSSGESS